MFRGMRTDVLQEPVIGLPTFRNLAVFYIYLDRDVSIKRSDIFREYHNRDVICFTWINKLLSKWKPYDLN